MRVANYVGVIYLCSCGYGIQQICFNIKIPFNYCLGLYSEPFFMFEEICLFYMKVMKVILFIAVRLLPLLVFIPVYSLCVNFRWEMLLLAIIVVPLGIGAFCDLNRNIGTKFKEWMVFEDIDYDDGF